MCKRTLIDVDTMYKSMEELGRIVVRIESPQMLNVSDVVRLSLTVTASVCRETVTTCVLVRVTVCSSVTVSVRESGCDTVRVRVSVGGGVMVSVCEGGVRDRVSGGVRVMVMVDSSEWDFVSMSETERDSTGDADSDGLRRRMVREFVKTDDSVNDKLLLLILLLDTVIVLDSECSCDSVRVPLDSALKV